MAKWIPSETIDNISEFISGEFKIICSDWKWDIDTNGYRRAVIYDDPQCVFEVEHLDTSEHEEYYIDIAGDGTLCFYGHRDGRDYYGPNPSRFNVTIELLEELIKIAKAKRKKT